MAREGGVSPVRARRHGGHVPEGSDYDVPPKSWSIPEVRLFVI